MAVVGFSESPWVGIGADWEARPSTADYCTIITGHGSLRSRVVRCGSVRSRRSRHLTAVDCGGSRLGGVSLHNSDGLRRPSLFRQPHNNHRTTWHFFEKHPPRRALWSILQRHYAGSGGSNGAYRWDPSCARTAVAGADRAKTRLIALPRFASLYSGQYTKLRRTAAMRFCG